MATNWGITDVLGTVASVNWCRAMVGTSPNTDSLILKSVNIRVGTSHSQQVRLAVYQGGVDADDPTGATLVWQGLTTGSGTSEWIQLSASDESLTKNVLTWIAIKGNDSGFSTLYQSTDPGGDFTSDSGRYLSDGAISSDESVAYPATWPSDSSTRSDFWYSLYLTYDIGTDYQIEGKTYSKSGTVLGTCDLLLMKDNEDDTATVVDYTTSDGSGDYSFTGIPDNDNQYFIYAWKDDSPHVMDVTDHVLLPKETPDTSYDLYLRSDTDKGETSPDKDLRLRSGADKIAEDISLGAVGRGIMVGVGRGVR